MNQIETSPGGGGGSAQKRYRLLHPDGWDLLRFGCATIDVEDLGTQETLGHRDKLLK